MSFSVKELIAIGDKVISRYTLRGTQQGGFAGILATGNKVEISGIMISRIENGKIVEEKEESIAWHYRMADPEQADLRAPELVDHLLNLTAKTDLQIVQGNKVVEVRRAGVDKGSAASFWLGEREHDFILAIGDDITDEDMFKALPASAVTIRVGITGTQAQYNTRNCAEVIDLLRSLEAATAPVTG